MKKVLALILAVVMVFALAACGAKEETAQTTDTAPVADTTAPAADTAAETEAEPEAADSDITIACVHRNLLGVSGVNFRAAYYYEAEQEGVNLIFFDGNQNVQAQCDYIDDCLSSDSADSFIVWTCDADGIASTVQNLHDIDMPCVTVDIMIDAESDAFVTAGNREMGVMSGESCVKYLTEKNGAPEGTVYIITATTQSTSRERQAGFEEVLNKYPDIEVVGIYDMPTTSIDDGVALADDLIQKNAEGSVDCYFCSNISSMLGLISAAGTYNRNDFMLFGGFDYNETVVENMRSDNCVVYSFAAQDCFRIGVEAFKLAVKGAKGERAAGETIYVEGDLVDASNLDEYMDNYLKTQEIIASFQ